MRGIKTAISPRDFAKAIGVSESSVKRWVDDGVIEASKTAGGHRKISVKEALRYIRSSGSPLLKPEILGLSEVASLGSAEQRAAAEPVDLFYRFLLNGDQEMARGLLLSLYLDGHSVAQLVDRALRPAMERIGELWKEEHSGIFCEHRATDIAIQAMMRLRTACAAPEGSPRAVGGAPSDDPYMLASIAAATVLEASGLAAVNLGANTPLQTFEFAAADLEAQLVWVSVSAAGEPLELSRGLQRLVRMLGERRVPLVIGGAAVSDLNLPNHPYLYVGHSMAELEALVRGMRTGSSSDEP